MSNLKMGLIENVKEQRKHTMINLEQYYYIGYTTALDITKHHVGKYFYEGVTDLETIIENEDNPNNYQLIKAEHIGTTWIDSESDFFTNDQINEWVEDQNYCYEDEQHPDQPCVKV